MITLFLTYELKVAVLIATFYIFWRLLTAKETWHRLNRIVLLSTAVASFILPLCVITIHQTVEVDPIPMEAIDETMLPETTVLQPETAFSPATVTPEQEHHFDWQLILAAIYIIGVAVVMSKMLLSICRLHKMALESEIHPLSDGRKIAINEEAKTPFSWWKTVFLNHKDFEMGTSALLTHELGHIRLHHSLDVILIELLTALQWFNPTMWMLRADLRTIHEYEADQQVISHGFNDIQYLHLLIRKAAVQSGYSLANGFINSTLKKRINMIMKPKSTSRKWLRFAYLLPIIGVSLAMSAKIQKEEVVNLGSSVVLDDHIEQLTDENRLIMLIDDMDDLKKIAPKKGLTRKVKSNLDFNDHFTRKSIDGKTIIVHLPKGSLYENDKESKKIDADINYAFPKGGFEWQLNGVTFDDNNIPALHFKTLKKIENHWNGKKNVVNLITSNESAIILSKKDGQECIGVKVPVGAFYTWLVNGQLAERGVVKEDKWLNVRSFCPLTEYLVTLDGKEINKSYVPYVPLNSIKEMKLIQGERPRRIELYTHHVTEFNRDTNFDYPAEYKEKVKAWMFFKAVNAATGQQLKGAEITVVETGQKAKTNDEGWCELKVPLGTTVKASYPGLKDESYEINHINGNDVQGRTFFMSKPDEHIYLNVDKKAEFIGDKDEWLAKNTHLPKAVSDEGISGNVGIWLVVNEDGSVSGVRLKQGVNKTLNEEALRLFRSMPRWRPALKDGKPVKSLVLTSVSFENDRQS
ncbi:MAG: energy transducer TonB [Prevotella sp.]|nr:energy transducer TonB [Prevotella sp.]